MAERRPRKRRSLRPEDQPVIDSLYDNTSAVYANNKDEEILDKDIRHLNSNLSKLIHELKVLHTDNQTMRNLSGKTGTGIIKEPSLSEDIKKSLLGKNRGTIKNIQSGGLMYLAARSILEEHNKSLVQAITTDLKKMAIQTATGNATTRIEAFKNRGLLGYITKYMAEKKAYQKAISAYAMSPESSQSTPYTTVNTQNVASKPVIENPKIDAPSFTPEIPEIVSTSKPRVSFKDSKMVFTNPPEISGPDVIQKQQQIKTWNEFQKVFKNKFDDVAEASLAWKEYKANQENLAEKWNKPTIEILSNIDEKMGGVLVETKETNELFKSDAFDKAESLREQKKTNDVLKNTLMETPKKLAKEGGGIGGLFGGLKGLFDGLLKDLTSGIASLTPALLGAFKQAMIPAALAAGNAALAYVEGKDAYNLLKDPKREQDYLEGGGHAASSLSSTIATGLSLVPGGQIPAAALMAGNAANRYLIQPGNEKYFGQRSKDALAKQNNVSRKFMADAAATRDRVEENKKPANLTLDDANTTEEQLAALEKLANNTSDDTIDFLKSGGKNRPTAVAMTEMPFLTNDLKMILKNRDALRRKKNDAAYINYVYNKQKKLLGNSSGDISKGELAQFAKQERDSSIPVNINSETLRSDVESYAVALPGMPQMYAMQGYARDKIFGDSLDVKAETVRNYRVPVPASLDVSKDMVDIAKTNQQTSNMQYMKARIAETMNAGKPKSNTTPIIIQSNPNINTSNQQPQTTVLTPLYNRTDDDTYLRSQRQSRNARLGL